MAFYEIRDLPAVQLAPGIIARVVPGAGLTVTHVVLDAGSILPVHSHVNEQVVNVVEGHLELTVDGKLFNLIPGTSLVLPPNVPHGGRAVTKCLVIDVFHPIRADLHAASEKTATAQR
jgi:quercetin dioxygenase-like cupin family protein